MTPSSASHNLPRPALAMRRGAFELVLLLAAASAAAPLAASAAEGPRGGRGGIEEVLVQSTRLPRTLAEAPLAVSVVTAEDLQLGRQQLGLDESLTRVPGVFLQNRYNFAQDLRISIRGFGSRAAFGIRGVQLRVDGIPATTPDGQGGIDAIDLGALSRVEVIRGPASALYGTAAGGVISLTTESGTATPYLETRVMTGEDDARRYQLKGGLERGRVNLFGSLSHLDIGGYRGHADTRSTLANGKAEIALSDTTRLTVVGSLVDSPQADDAGALTLAEALAVPSQGRQRNIDFDAGESLEQLRAGATLTTALGPGELSLRGYGVDRDFANRLPFGGTVAESNGGQVELQRAFYGGGADYALETRLGAWPVQMSAGFEVDRQRDDRRRFVNELGAQGALTFDQVERVDAFGAFLQADLSLGDYWQLALGLRHDRVSFEVADRFLANASGDDSGREQFEQLSPLVGLVFAPSQRLNLYANLSRAFETPSTTEFANPDGGGFNPGLDAQVARGLEFGARGELTGRWRYEVTLYRLDVDDELVPFQRPGDERVFYENAGASSRRGLELLLAGELGAGFETTLAYSRASLEFDDFRDADGNRFDGNDIPGNPGSQLFVELAWRGAGGLYLIADCLLVGEFYADNANAVEIDRYEVANLRGGVDWRTPRWSVSPFVGVNNLFDESYFGNVRPNGAFGRFYEPAPERNLYAGVSVRRRFPGR